MTDKVWPPSAPDDAPLTPDNQGYATTPLERDETIATPCALCGRPVEVNSQEELDSDGPFYCDRH